jgi:hypothetical protein
MSSAAAAELAPFHSVRSSQRFDLVSAARGLAVDAVVAAAIFTSICILGMRQFGGYDHSAMIQSGWLQLRSFVPFKDFPCTFPPLFFLGTRYAFLLFGVRWKAFVLLMAVFATLSFFFLIRQLRALGFTAASATSLALTAEMGTAVVCSFWWHNPITSLVGIMTFTSALVCLAHPNDNSGWLLLGAAFTLLVLSKPNVWPIGACLLPLFASQHASQDAGRDASQRPRVMGVMALAVLLSGVLCWLHGLSPFGVLHTYADIAQTRGNPLRSIVFREWGHGDATTMVGIAAALMCLFLGVLITNRHEVGTYWRQYFCCLVTALTSLAMFNMNYEIKTSDLTPLVIALAVAAYRPWSERRLDGFGRIATVTVMAALVAISGYWGVTRTRVRNIGEGKFFESAATETMSSGFFAGLHSGPHLPRVLHQIESVLGEYPAQRIFFGPRMEFAYAAFRREPPRGMPIWWDPGTSFAMGDFYQISRAFDHNTFDLLIFLKDDYTRFGLLYKLSAYQKVTSFSDLDVYVRRKEW